MKTIITTFVRKVLAIHPDDTVSKQEIAFTLFAFLFMIIFLSIIVRSLIIPSF
jgi:hypothetical protein